MTDWNEAVDATRAQFVEHLEQRGFTLDSTDRLTGHLSLGETTHHIVVTLNGRFPFAPPSVYPQQDLPRSWHRELDGAMCLYPSAGREELPWLDPDDFIATIHRWLHESQNGWSSDSPDLDLQRYFYAAADSHLLTYDNIGALLNRYVRLRRDSHTITVVGPGAIPAKAVTDKRRAFGYVADIGEPDRPPQDWDQIAELLDPTTSTTIDKAIRDGRIKYLLVQYKRQTHTAVLALETHHTTAGIELRALASAPNDLTALTLRSGIQAATLHNRHVLVVGAGAVGSFTCDALARAGLGNLTVRDSDVLRPGNLIRHLADERHVGKHKVIAIRETILARPHNVTTVTAEPHDLTEPTDVAELLDRYDLVIDATADAAVSTMLNAAARASRAHIVSACLQEEGRVVRVDIIPSISGDPHPAVTPSAQTTPAVYEAGCGDPVSLTPYFAVTEAASLAARHAVGILTGAPLTNAGDVRDYR